MNYGNANMPEYYGAPIAMPNAGVPSISGGNLNYGGQLGGVPLDQGFNSNANVSALMGGNPNASGAMPGLGGVSLGGVAGKQPGFVEKAMGGEYGGLEGWGQMLGGLGDVGSAYMAYKNYGLANDQFDFQKQVTNRNMANQSVIANAKMEAWAKARGMAVPQTDGRPITA